MTVTFAVVASGGMGAGVGRRLAQGGARVLTSLAGRSAASVARANSAGMADAPLEELAGATVFLSIVPPDQALPLARRMAPLLRATPHPALYVDLNAVSPATAEHVAEAIAGTGAVFVDGGIIGLPPTDTGPGPSFYLSGDSQAAADAMRGAGLVVKQLEGGVGAASALKLSYAGITKGMTALAACMALAADRAGVGPALHAELADSQAALLARFGKSVPDMFGKAYRWVPEMREIEAFIGATRPEAAIFQGAAELYAQIAADKTAVETLARFFTP